MKFEEYIDNKNIINESIETAAKKIAKLVDYNDHNAAYCEAAKLVGNKKMLKAFEGIKAIHEFENEMPSGVYEYRYTLSKKLNHLGKAKFKNWSELIKI